MSAQRIFASRTTRPASTYVGHKGLMFYDETTGALRIGDGVTPGGRLVEMPPATSTRYGGVKLGPGIALNGENQIIIDSGGLNFNFGDFYATTEPDGTQGATLSSIDLNQDINIVSNGTGSVNIIGELKVYKPDGNVAGAMAIEPIFRVKTDGQIKMLVPGADSTEGAVGIVGGLDGVFQAPLNTGVMLHITGIAGSPGVPSRLYNDAQNSFAAFVARRYNNTAASPTAVLADEEVMRISGTAHNGTNIPATASQRIVYKALGNQTLTNQGGYIELWTTPLNSTSLAKIATIDNANGITSTKFTGPLIGNVTGTATTATYAESFNTGTLVANSVNAQVATTTTNFNTGTLVANSVNAQVATTTTNFNTGTLVANAVTASKVANALTVGYGLKLDTNATYDGSVARTINKYDTITGPVTVVANAYSLDLGTCNGVVILNNSDVSFTLTITGTPVAGKIVRVIVNGGMRGNTTVTVSGLTATNSSSGSASFQATSPNASSPTVEFICTTTALSGVYMNLSGAK